MAKGEFGIADRYDSMAEIQLSREKPSSLGAKNIFLVEKKSDSHRKTAI